MMQKYQLRNGLKVILLESHKSPVVTVQAWVKTGSADEQKGEEGISHFIEHLLFKGTQTFKVGEIASRVEGSGGELNAYTSFDQTVFHVTISKSFADVALETVSQMMGYPLFDSKEIDNEREVVIEEIKRSLDNPGRESSRLLFSTVYEEHPYCEPVIGYTENIQTFSRKDILKYYNSRYVPENMTLLVIGDFASAEMKKKVAKYFEGFEKRKIRSVKRKEDPKQSELKIGFKKSNFKETMVNVAFRTPSVTHADAPALEILGFILGQGESSRLIQRLRIQEPLVNYIGAYSYLPKDAGFICITLGVSPEGLNKVLDVLGEELINFFVEPPTPEELQKALTVFESEDSYSLETVDGLARKVGTYELLFHDPEYHEVYMEKIRSVTCEDLQKVLHKYFVPENLTVTALSPKVEDQKKIEEWAANLQFALELGEKTSGKVVKAKNKKASSKKINSKKSQPSQSEVIAVEVDGIRILMRENSETPVISVKVAALGGLRAEEDSQGGLTELLSNTWTSGTTQKTETEIAHILDGLASSLKPFAGRNSIGLGLTTLKKCWRESFDLLFEVLTDPLFPSEAVEREKTLMVESIKQKQDHPAERAIQQFSEMIFKNHPYARDMYGTIESLTDLTSREVKAHWQRMINRQNLTIALSGDFSVEEMKSYLKEKIRTISDGKKWNQIFPIENLTTNLSKTTMSAKEQSHIVWGVRGLDLYDDERIVLLVMEAILSGQGGRLFLELRDKASLAYTVMPIHMEGLETGYFATYIGCSPEKSDKAIRMMKEECWKLTKEEISKEELERAQRYLIGQHDIGLQKNSSISSSLLFEDIYGLPWQNVFNFSERVKAITQAQVKSLAKKLFSQKEVLSIVGPKETAIATAARSSSDLMAE